MMRIIDQVTVPPGGWTFYVEETKTHIDGQTLRECVNKTINHLLSNELDISPIIDHIIEDSICKRLAPGKCYIPMDKKDVGSNTQLTLAQVIAGTKTISRWLLKGAKKVHVDLANDRGKVCAACPYNKPVSGCASCASNRIRQIAGDIIGSSKTTSDHLLNVCVSCGCMLRASVWLPLDIQQRHISETVNDGLPSHCWKKRL